jgi:hypothetical protein
MGTNYEVVRIYEGWETEKPPPLAQEAALCYNSLSLSPGPFRSRYWDYQSGNSVIPFLFVADIVYHVSPHLATPKKPPVRLTQVAFLNHLPQYPTRLKLPLPLGWPAHN